jgi:hypothetical protein
LSQTHACIECGESSVATLDFDHPDPTVKTTEIGSMIGKRSWTTIELEVAKCVVRCANCHRRRTTRQRLGTDPFPYNSGARE